MTKEHKIKKVFIPEGVEPMEFENHQVLKVTEHFIDDEPYQLFEVVDNEVDLCNNWVREEDMCYELDYYKRGLFVKRELPSGEYAIILCDNHEGKAKNFTGTVVECNSCKWQVGEQSDRWGRLAWEPYYGRVSFGKKGPRYKDFNKVIPGHLYYRTLTGLTVVATAQDNDSLTTSFSGIVIQSGSSGWKVGHSSRDWSKVSFKEVVQ